MLKTRESSTNTKAKIMEAARILFAEKGPKGVSLRMIAKCAGINHALIIRYFSSKDTLFANVLANEIDKWVRVSAINTSQDMNGVFLSVKKMIVEMLSNPDAKTSLQLITRAEMDGLAPEKMLQSQTKRLTNGMAKFIKSKQTDPSLPDARLIAIVIMSAITSLITIGPWYLSAVGISEDDFGNYHEALADILIRIILQSTGFPSEALYQRV